MCVRTKTSYGCGHVYKNTNDCYSSACTGVDRYHYLKEGDCRECKSGGTTVSRGREGKGRYAQEIHRSKVKDAPASSSKSSSASQRNVSGGASPWVTEPDPEKTWQSPHRKQADEAWVSEHQDRISDLQERLDKVQLSERPRPSYSKELVIISDKHDYDDDDQDDYDTVHETPSKKRLPIDIRQRSERSQPHRHQDRQYSHDSLPDSMPSYRSSPKLRKPSTFNAVNAYPDPTYEYDYYNNTPSTHASTKQHHSHKRHQHTPSRSKSDSHHVHRSRGYDSDYEISPIPPLQIPPPVPAVYDTYEYYSPNASPSGAPYTFPDYPYDMGPGHPPVSRPHHYVNFHPRY